jgi:uroporphyrin-III C-methyltransferase / precorrin-2 dehydrogenase / sirohydrochlorin ferrochelatase
MGPVSDRPPYPSGLRLAGRRVLVVGGGHVAQRRVPGLLAAGAEVVVVSPEVTPAIEGQVLAGEVAWLPRGFADDDLEETWYVIAATNDPTVNEQVSKACEAARIFCVRADDASTATAWTPAVGRYDGLTLAVLGRREPRRTAAVRDAIVTGLHEGTIGAGERRPSVPGVTLVGGGPGDPELISVAGRRALMEADVVVADRLAPRELLGDLPATTEVVDVAKLPRGRSARQEEINRLIVERALAGQRVARFKGGDSFVFGRGFEEIEACRAAGVAVTHRGVAHDFSVVSGHVPPGHADSLVDWEALGRLRGTLLLMMAVENAAVIAEALLAAGRPGDTPVAVVCDGSMPGERTVLSRLADLGADLDRHAVRPPAIIVVGDVVAVAHPQHFSAWQS